MRADAAIRSSAEQPGTLRQQRFSWLATAMAGATLATCVLVTADAASVFQGESLPQVLLILLTGLVASFGSISFLPAGKHWRWWTGILWLLLAGLLLSTLSATWFANGRAAWNGFWHVIGLLMFGMIARQLCRQRAVAGGFAQLLIVGAIAMSVHAVHQVTISLPETRAAYERDPERALAELNLDAPPGSVTRARYESRLYSSEALGNFALANSLAVLLSGALVGLSIWITQALRVPSQNRIALLAAGLAWLLILAAWLLTKSRTAYLSVALVLTATAALWWWQQRRFSADKQVPAIGSLPKWIASVVLACSVGFGALVVILARDRLILSEAPKSVAYRLEYWQASARMILEAPLSGVGLGNFQSYYPRYKLLTASEIVADPHNWLLDIAATCSLPVLALVLVGLVMLMAHSWACLQTQPDSLSDPERANKLSRDVAGGNRGLPTKPEQRLVKALWIGAAVGWISAAAVQWLVQSAIDVEASALGLLVGLIAIALMRLGGPATDVVCRSAAVAAVTTMLVCLLASGSWQASGLAIPLATWLAICSASSLDPGQVGKVVQAAGMLDPARPMTVPSATVPTATVSPLTARALALVLLFAFWLQCWRPVHVSWTEQQMALAALSAGKLDAAQEAALASVAADPIDPAPRRLLVQILTADASQQTLEQFPSFSRRVTEAVDLLLDCDPAPAQNWSFAGETYVTLASQTEALLVESKRVSPTAGPQQLQGPTTPRDPSVDNQLRDALLNHAELRFAAAVDRYPSSVALHLQRAVVLRLLGRASDARRAAEAAFAISQATPHLDRKLGMQQVWLPPPLGASELPQSARAPLGSSMWVQAEPLCDFLRKN